MPDNVKSLKTAEQALEFARRAGATHADCVLFSTTDVNLSCRHQKPEGIERSENSALGLRAWVNKKQAIVSATDMQESVLHELAERAVAMAKEATDDADSTLAPDHLLTRDIPSLDLYDAQEPSEEWLFAQCKEAEATALAVKGITNSEGADAHYSASVITLATSAGFAQSYDSSYVSLSLSVLAGEGTGMERDYAYRSVRHVSDLASAVVIGREAAERTLARMNPKRTPTCQVPVIFDPRVARGLVSSLASAINGGSVARGTSFLKDKMGQNLFAANVQIVDDPHLKRGLGSKPFDAEGVRGMKRYLVKDGVLTTWLLDMRSANKLKLETTGHATRGIASPPGPSSTNLHMLPGTHSPKELMADIQSGFYVTETFGMGVNLVTGDYSQGAAGFWIERGELTHAVSELTIAGHLSEMFTQLTPANDLEFRYSTNAPTIRVERMTVAGA